MIMLNVGILVIGKFDAKLGNNEKIDISMEIFGKRRSLNLKKLKKIV